jgi:hypothetical protein
MTAARLANSSDCGIFFAGLSVTARLTGSRLAG